MPNGLTFLHQREWHIELIVLAGVLSAILGIVGAYWDIGWHFDFGRDTFWSPPHLMIYGSIWLMTGVLLLNLVVAKKHNLAHKQKALFYLILFGLGANGLVYLSAPIDELWHRLYGIDVQIISLPHLMLIFGSILGGAATISILRYHILHERQKFLLEQALIPVFLASILAGLMIIFAESEFSTLPPWHPVQNRATWVYPGFSIVFALLIFLAAKLVSRLRWSATLTFLAFAIFRVLPTWFNNMLGMKSVPIIPPFLPILFIMALVVDWVKRNK